jgi:purine-cytosine permease-like protein
VVKKDWLIYGLLLIGAFVSYQQGRLDAEHMLRVTVGVVTYLLAQFGIRFVRVSEEAKSAFMAILLSLLLIWILDASLSTALWVIALVGLRFFTQRARRDPRSEG